MSQQQMSPLAGVLRVLFFLAVAVVAVTVVVSGVTTLYEAPSGDEGGFQELEGFRFDEDEESADYNRNLGLIFGLIGTATIAVGLLGLGSRFNPLRAGLLAGGVGLVLAGVGVGSSGSDDWLVFLTSGLALLVLIGSAYWLDEGLPLESLTGGTPRGGGDSGSGEGQALGGGEPGLDERAGQASRNSRA
jgi:hypothetical protein